MNRIITPSWRLSRLIPIVFVLWAGTGCDLMVDPEDARSPLAKKLLTEALFEECTEMLPGLPATDCACWAMAVEDKFATTSRLEFLNGSPISGSRTDPPFADFESWAETFSTLCPGFFRTVTRSPASESYILSSLARVCLRTGADDDICRCSANVILKRMSPAERFGIFQGDLALAFWTATGGRDLRDIGRAAINYCSSA